MAAGERRHGGHLIVDGGIIAVIIKLGRNGETARLVAGIEKEHRILIGVYIGIARNISINPFVGLLAGSELGSMRVEQVWKEPRQPEHYAEYREHPESCEHRAETGGSEAVCKCRLRPGQAQDAAQVVNFGSDSH